MMKVITVLSIFVLSACQDNVTVDVVDRAATQTTAYKPGSKVVVDSTRDAETQGTSYPLVMLDASEVCEGIKYYNRDGILTTGERICDMNSLNLLPQNIRAGVIIGGVTGVMVPADTTCSKDGEVGCVTSADMPAASAQNLAAKVMVGQTVAGISGTAAGQTYSNCTTDGATSCVATAAFPAAMATGLASKVAAGQTVAGVVGTAPAESHALCAADGGTSCVVSLPYRAALTTGLSDKVLSGQTVAGVNGNVTLPAAGLVYTGTSFGINGNSAIGTLTLPTAANVRSGNGAFGVAGSSITPTLANCSTDGGVGCVAVGPNFAAALTTGLAAKVVTGQSVAGISGSAAAETHNNCSADGATGCVATSTYTAA
ncbi:MAG TPA: hypothetical protein VE954_01270 [Oligoflexus sp.]|uniref:hypothetical protein n=1 Tax=Oligoflexus sp. TaxID=1971216 RepID=UPI002D4E6220|nr:hypothetical protein [Oligoflexus sp.]HYX31712.1 hypothetical protein [Oligoflexus sp.]